MILRVAVAVAVLFALLFAVVTFVIKNESIGEEARWVILVLAGLFWIVFVNWLAFFRKAGK